MTLDEIKWVAALYETGNISKAAEKLFISQSALSQCLRRVEEQLGFQLFQRAGKRIVATKNAELFYEMADSILGSYDDFLEKVYNGENTQLNEIRLALPAAVNGMVYNELISELGRVRPDIKFKIIEGSAAELWEELKHRRVELIAVSGKSPISEAVSYPIIEIETLVLLRRESSAAENVYTENGFRYLDPIYLKDEPLALMRRGHTSRDTIEKIFSDCGITANIVQETRSVQMLESFAESGNGSAVSLCLPSIAGLKPEKVIICRIPPEYNRATVPCAIYALTDAADKIPNNVYRTICGVIRKALTVKY